MSILLNKLRVWMIKKLGGYANTVQIVAKYEEDAFAEHMRNGMSERAWESFMKRRLVDLAVTEILRNESLCRIQTCNNYNGLSFKAYRLIVNVCHNDI